MGNKQPTAAEKKELDDMEDVIHFMDSYMSSHRNRHKTNDWIPNNDFDDETLGIMIKELAYYHFEPYYYTRHSLHSIKESKALSKSKKYSNIKPSKYVSRLFNYK